MATERIEDMHARIVELRRLLVASMTDEQRLYQRFQEARREADRWRARAGLAASRGMDDLARAALERAAENEARASEHHLQYLEQKSRVQEMKSRILGIEAGVGTTRPLVTADPTKVERTLARLHHQEERAEEQRARLAALAELDRDEVAEKLAALERDDRLERQLAELKARLGVERQ